MPNKYHLRSYTEGGFYHIFNRGVNKDVIFRDYEDYDVFTFFLSNALQQNANSFEMRKNFFGLVSLHCHCLMPNHFHLLLRELHKGAITSLMRSVTISYALYFNKKYDHTGTIYETKYKAKMVNDDEYLLHVSRYIHLNAQDMGVDPLTYPYSSIRNYINPNQQLPWISTEFVSKLLNEGNPHEAYHRFMLDTDKYDAKKFSFE